MGPKRDTPRFSEQYGDLRTMRGVVREDPPVSEAVVQCVWYDQVFVDRELRTADGHALEVVWPGWWNHGEGPDFKDAQIRFNSREVVGDVEIHCSHADWRGHGHHQDARYDQVRLLVVLEHCPATVPPTTSKGRAIPVVLLPRFLTQDIRTIADGLLIDHYPYRSPAAAGECATVAQAAGPEPILALLALAGEWRMLTKARALRDRMVQVGVDQAIYEAFLSACGFGPFKFNFQAIARQFPYERTRQLVTQDPFLLEAALLQVAALLPGSLPAHAGPVPHFGRLDALRRGELAGLKSLPLVWRRVGVRPTNNPERRLAGAVRFLARTSGEGLAGALERVWAQDTTPIKRRRALEALFPSAMGFWAEHCTWTGRELKRPCAPLGAGRARSIIGNVFVPAALALARERRDRVREERVLGFFATLPKEPDNQILRVMAPRLFGTTKPAKLTFRTQQGALQIYQDWCASNPTCRNCTVMQYLLASSPKAADTSAPLS